MTIKIDTFATTEGIQVETKTTKVKGVDKNTKHLKLTEAQFKKLAQAVADDMAKGKPDSGTFGKDIEIIVTL